MTVTAKYRNRLGDVDRLQEQIAARPPLKSAEIKELREYYRIGFTWSSNALEGNSLTEVETKVVLEDGITIGGKPLRDHYEAVGHSDAYDFLHQLARRQGITEAEILKLHHLFYRHIDEKNAGHYRRKPVIVTGALVNFPPPAELKRRMAEYVAAMGAQRGEVHPVQYAAELHTGLVTIHPFIDGNGRAARLILNLALLQYGYPVTIIPPVLRPDYIEAVRRGNVGDTAPFINFLSCMVWEAQREYLRLLDGLGVGVE